MALAGELETWRTQAQKGTVYWLESYESRRGFPRLTLAAAPVDIGPAMREQLFDKVPTVIMTSATLSVGRSPAERARQLVGGTRSRIRSISSNPASASRNATKCKSAARSTIASRPNWSRSATCPIRPSAERGNYEKKCIEAIQHYAGLTDGHTFVLFTSYDMLRRVSAGLAALARRRATCVC